MSSSRYSRRGKRQYQQGRTKTDLSAYWRERCRWAENVIVSTLKSLYEVYKLLEASKVEEAKLAIKMQLIGLESYCRSHKLVEEGGEGK